MADQMLGVVLEAVLSQAFSLANERISGAWGVEDDLQSMGRRLEMIQEMLADADMKSTTSRSVQVWLKNLEEVSADAQCLLDEFGYHLLRKQIEKRSLNKVRHFFSPANPIAFRFKMASEIKKFNLRFDGIFKESERIGLFRRNEMINSSSVDIRKDRITDPFVVDTEVVGRDHNVAKVVSLLTSLEEENDLPVIGIVGMGGQGKTTLAQLVYNKEEVTRYFQKRIWVCVSDVFDVNKILNDMVESTTGQVCKLTMRDKIVEKLQQQLKEKRFLLVLDDVWNENKPLWDSMDRCLLNIGGSKGSKIIITTRSDSVVRITRSFHLHQLGVLSEGHSWQLFEKIAFAEGEAEKTSELVCIGEKVVKRCGGLPLAIKAVAGLMRYKRDAGEWSKIAESNIWNDHLYDYVNTVLSIVKLSYDHLPTFSLKQCFAYCAIFKKDSIMKKDELIQQWMAHGLLNPSQGSTLQMEDVGNNYFEILVQRSLFQDFTFDEFGNVKSCKMHDVVHDFVSGASKDRCLIIEDGRQSENIKVVHLSVNAYSSQCQDAMVNFPFKLRSLFLNSEKSLNLLSGRLAECKHLCVLVLNVQMQTLRRSIAKMEKKFPISIAKMKNLRYLDLSRVFIKGLLNSITKLYKLQTLIISSLEEELPRDFGNLVNLRHFCIRELHFLNPPSTFVSSISGLTSLRTLPYFLVSRDRKCEIKELQYLNNLEGNLQIFGLENVNSYGEAMKADLSSKKNVVNLVLCWNNVNREEGNNYKDVLEGLKPPAYLKGLKIQRFPGRSLPSWMQSLDYLVSLELERLEECEKIPPLGQLPCLKVLKILQVGSLKCIDSEFYGVANENDRQTSSSSCCVSFPSLKELELEGMENLEEWSDPPLEYEVFPVLDRLTIRQVPKLTHLPNVLNKISSLKKLDIALLENLSHLPEGLGLLFLEELSICNCPNLVVALNKEIITGLRKLRIRGCKKVGILQNRLDLCEKLEELEISKCSSIRIEDLCCPANLRKLGLGLSEDVDYEEFPWPSRKFPSSKLEVVRLRGNSKTKSLPKQIQHLPALREWWVRKFGRMEALPEWLCNIPSLQELRFMDCENLAYLPSKEALQSLSPSCQLYFERCPGLKKRCKEGKWSRMG